MRLMKYRLDEWEPILNNYRDITKFVLERVDEKKWNEIKDKYLLSKTLKTLDWLKENYDNINYTKEIEALCIFDNDSLQFIIEHICLEDYSKLVKEVNKVKKPKGQISDSIYNEFQNEIRDDIAAFHFYAKNDVNEDVPNMKVNYSSTRTNNLRGHELEIWLNKKDWSDLDEW